MNQYPIVFACDEKYALPFGVVVESLLANKLKDTFYDIYCLIPEDFSEKTIEKLNSLNTRYSNFKINLINLENTFENVSMKIDHISFVTYYRFKIPELLPQYEKALYLDVDIIVTEDLGHLFREELDNEYLAAVKHPTLLHRQNILGFKCPENSYFNAGVLLLNIKKIRNKHKDKEMIDLIPNNFPIQDQDILNVTCATKVKYLDIRYNLMTRLCEPAEKYGAKSIYGNSFKESLKNPGIIHYANKEKPWEFKNIYFNNVWDQYFMLSGFKNDIKLETRCKINYVKKNFKSIIVLIKKILLKNSIINGINRKFKAK